MRRVEGGGNQWNENEDTLWPADGLAADGLWGGLLSDSGQDTCSHSVLKFKGCLQPHVKNT